MSIQPAEKQLGNYLKGHRARLDPAAFGFSSERRRTLGLRREEVAQRARISTTWYTWLEQGRGGAPSADVLERIARALMLTEVERERMFLLALGRLPEARYHKNQGISLRLQRVLNALEPSPAIIKTATWDVIAWNQGGSLLLGLDSMQPEQHNLLRFMFLSPRARAAHSDWASMARLVLSEFRLDAARAGAAEEVKPLIKELCALSPEFDAMWKENDVPADQSETVKHMQHPELGLFSVEYSAFAVGGRPDLILVVYNPATPSDLKRITSLLRQR